MLTRAIVFSDIVGSSAILEAIGDARWVEVLHDLDRLVAQLAAEAGGRLRKSMGDGHLLDFPDAASGVRFALALQGSVAASTPLELGILLRIGIHEGEVVEHDGDLGGRTVHIAARLGALAGAGEVVCSSTVAEAIAAEPGLGVSAPRTVVLRGLEGLHDVSVVSAVTAAEPRHVPSQEILLDRAVETGALEVLLGHALNGLGGVAFLVAPAGMGKSSLLRHAVRRAETSGLSVISARGDELETSYPLGLATQILEQIAKDRPDDRLAELLSGEARFARPLLGLSGATPGFGEGHRERRALSAVCLTAAAEKPTALVIDDLQWADLPSLRWLAQLSRRVTGNPLALILAGRPIQVGEVGELMNRIGQQPGVGRLVPRPLSRAAVAVLVQRYLGDADSSFVTACGDVTDGNPHLLKELLRSLSDDGVRGAAGSAADVKARERAGLSRVVLARLGPLGSAAMDFATAAAIFPNDTSVRLVSTLANLDADVAEGLADTLATAGVLDNVRPLRFAHPLGRQAIYDEIPRGRRSHLHRAAMRLLTSDEAPVQDIAAHALMVEPGDDAEIVDVLRLAAARARSLGAPEIAATYLRRAMAEPPLTTVRDIVRTDLAELERMLQNYDAAIAAGSAVLDTSTDGSLRRRALESVTGSLTFGLRRWSEAAERIRAELAVADSTVTDYRLYLMSVANEYDDIAGVRPQTTAAALMALAEEVADPGPGVAAVLQARAFELMHELRGEPDVVTDLMLRAVQLEPAGRDLSIFTWNERPDLALPRISAELAAAQRDGDYQRVAHRNREMGDAMLALGNLVEAEKHYRSAYDLTQHENAMATIHFAWVLLLRGKTEDARAVLSEKALTAPPEQALQNLGNPFIRSLLWHVRGLLAVHDGDLKTAEVEATRSRRDSAWKPAPAECRLAEVLLAQGRREDALLEAELLVTDARKANVPSRLGLALAIRARCMNQAEVGLEELREAMQLLIRGCDRTAEAEGLVIQGELLRRAGRRVEARQPLAQGRSLALECGAETLAAWAASEQSLVGAKPRRTAVSGVAALTATEGRVAALAAEGNSNLEIAHHLIVSARTVEMHLGRVYRKLGITGRSDLAGALGPAL